MNKPPRYRNLVCRGSLALGTGCGHCERCAHERQLQHQPFIPLQRMDFIRLHSGEVGTVFEVNTDGSVQACLDSSAGQIVTVPVEQLRGATLLVRDNKRVSR